jgi:hypothetical protein
LGFRWGTAVALAVIVVASVVAGFSLFKGSKTQFSTRIVVCGEAGLARVVEDAVEKSGLQVSVAVWREGMRFEGREVLVVNVSSCTEAGSLLASALLAGDPVLLVGRPWEVSAAIKSQHRILMVYPLPKVNVTIIYFVRVVRTLSTTTVYGSEGYIVAPEVNYWKGVTVDSMASAVRFALSRLKAGGPH